MDSEADNELTVNQPSWKETTSLLSPNQLIMAEISSNVNTFSLIKNQIKAREPYYRRLSQGGDKDAPSRHFAGAIDYINALKGGPEEIWSLANQWGDEFHFIEGMVKPCLGDIENNKDKVFENAKNWGPRDAHRINREASLYFQKLPQEEKALLLQNAYGFKPLGAGQTAIETGVTIGINVASSHLLEGLASVGGAAAATVNPLGYVPTAVAGLALLGSYYFWGKGVQANFKETWNMLEEKGISTSGLAKAGYDASKKFSNNLNFQKASTLAGYMAVQIFYEIPYYVVAFSGGPDKLASLTGSSGHNSGIAFLAGANLVAAGYNYAQAHLTRGYLNQADNIEGNVKGLRTKIVDKFKK